MEEKIKKLDFSIGIFDNITDKIKKRIEKESNNCETYAVGIYTDEYIMENLLTYPSKTADERANIVNNIPKFKHCIVLMHDAADKKATVEALPEIIDAINGMEDTVMVPITDDTLPVQHIKNN